MTRRVMFHYVISSRLASRYVTSCLLPWHLFSCRVLVMSSLVLPSHSFDTPVVSCLGTGPVMSFHWCHLSCITSCRLVVRVLS